MKHAYLIAQIIIAAAVLLLSYSVAEYIDAQTYAIYIQVDAPQ